MPKPSVLFFFVGLFSGLIVAGMRPAAEETPGGTAIRETGIAPVLGTVETLPLDRGAESAAWEEFWVEAAPAHWENRWRGVSRVDLKSCWDAMGADLRASWEERWQFGYGAGQWDR